MAECGRKGAARIAQGRDKHIDANRLTTDADALLAKINLQLVTRRRLEPCRRARFCRQRLPKASHCSLDCPQTRYDTDFTGQIRPHDVCVARCRKNRSYRSGEGRLAVIG